MSVPFRPILLKKWTTVSTAEKYAPEIEIFILSRGLRAQISRSSAQERRFQHSVHGQPGKTDFFNTIGRFLPVEGQLLAAFHLRQTSDTDAAQCMNRNRP